MEFKDMSLDEQVNIFMKSDAEARSVFIKSLSEEQKKSFLDALCGPEIPKWNKEELGYRRGYRQGFAAARRRLDVSVDDVYYWSHNHEKTCPPGSFLEGTEMHGLTEDDAHRFFMHKLRVNPIGKEESTYGG